MFLGSMRFEVCDQLVRGLFIVLAKSKVMLSSDVTGVVKGLQF
ncbi:hypothetical protein [Anaplasma phagocytophilum]